MPVSQVIIDMHGDSTTQGGTKRNGAWGISPNNVPAALQRKYGANVVVNNKGIPGLTAPQRCIGALPALETWEQAMSISPAHIVTINYGINDANSGWETDNDVNFYFSELIRIAQEHGKTVLVETSNPINTPQYARLSQIALVIRQLAQSKGLTLADHHQWIQTGLPNWTELLSDGVVHPNDALYQYKADNLYIMINPLVQWYLTH